MQAKKVLKHVAIIAAVTAGSGLVTLIACSMLRVFGQPPSESPDTMVGLMQALLALSFLSVYMKGIKRSVRFGCWVVSLGVCFLLSQGFYALFRASGYTRTSLYEPTSLGTAWDLATLLTFAGLALMLWSIRKRSMS